MADIEDTVRRAEAIMVNAARLVLGQRFTMTTESAIFKFPDRYMDPKRGKPTWDRVMQILDASDLTFRTSADAFARNYWTEVVGVRRG